MLLKTVSPNEYRNYNHTSLVCSYCLVKSPCQLSGTVFKCIISPSGFAVMNRYYASMTSQLEGRGREWGVTFVPSLNCKTCRFAYWGGSHVAVDIWFMYRSNRSFNMPRATPRPGIWLFLKVIVQIPPYPGQNAVQIPHTRVQSGDQMPPPRRHFTGT